MFAAVGAREAEEQAVRIRAEAGEGAKPCHTEAGDTGRLPPGVCRKNPAPFPELPLLQAALSPLSAVEVIKAADVCVLRQRRPESLRHAFFCNVQLEVEEECMANKLLKRLEQLRREKQSLAVQARSLLGMLLDFATGGLYQLSNVGFSGLMLGNSNAQLPAMSQV